MKCCAKINDFICVSNTFILFAFLDAYDHQKNNEKKSNKENANGHNDVNSIEWKRTVFKIPFD